MVWGTLLGSGAGAVAGGLLGGPVGAGVGMSLGGMLGGAVEGAFDDTGPAQAAYVDPSLYDTSGYDSISADAKAKAAAAAERQGPAANWGLDDQSRAMANQTRDRQMALADDLDAYLRGDKASLAELQARRAQIATANEIQQQAANARGGVGAQIAAQRQAATLGVASQLESNARFNELRAQEETAARGQLGQLLGQARGQDLGTREGDQGRSRFDVTTAQQNQAQNDAMTRFYEDLRFKGVQGGAQANQAYGAAQQGAAGQVLGINAQREQAAADRNAAMTGKVMEAGVGYAGIAAQENKNRPPTEEEWQDAWNKNGGEPTYKGPPV